MNNHTTPPAADVLRDKNWLPDGVSVTRTEIAGAGNMNLVERVYLDNGLSLILKRSRGWVEKYPDIPAPIERAGVEAAFYAAIKGTDAGNAMPKHLGYDPADATNLYEDLGEGKDGAFIYAGQDLPLADLNAVARWTAALHTIPVTDDMQERFINKAMRELNALHIFNFPLDPNNGFTLDDITPGLQALGDALKADTNFTQIVQHVAARYLAAETQPGDVLLHGDLYPGSWLTTDEGLFLIDPEFCWIGPAEWDVGVLLAHLRLSGQSVELGPRFITHYDRPLDETLMNQITRIEIMRRLIGVAQLPLDIDLAAKAVLLEEARALVTGHSS